LCRWCQSLDLALHMKISATAAFLFVFVYV